MEDREKRFKNFDKRLGCLQICFAIFAIILIIYLFAIQILDIKKYRVKAKFQRIGKQTVMRGDILDRNGIKLATDKVYFTFYARPKAYDHTPEELAKLLAPQLKVSKNVLLEKLKGTDPIILLKKDAPKETAQAVKKLNLREISFDKKTTRVYPQGSMAAQVLGYYNIEANVSAGIELTAKDKLEHIEKATTFERTQDGKIIYDFSTDPVAATVPIKGNDLTLTIDTAIQHVCEQELAKMVTSRKALRGTVIVMNPKNGEILAYALYPTYDPNDYRKATLMQTKNWALTDVFPPGSTFKTITIASAIELGKINKYSKIHDTGKIKVGWWDIKNYDYSAHPYPGWITLKYLFEHSSNVGSVRVAQMMSSQEFYTILKKFGIGTKTGIDLPGESAGLLPPWQKWDSATHATMGYGYGASVTPIQMISAVSAIANNGVRVTPHIIKYSPEEAENKIFSTQVMTPENARTVTELLTESINSGKSQIKMDSYNIAAKTGTSKKPNENSAGYSNKLYTSIIGYLPSSDPQVLIYVLVDSAQGGEVWGNTIAAPVFKEISTQVARIMNLKPDKHTK